MLESGLPEEIGDDEDLARFLFSSGQYNLTIVKPSAFLPHTIDQETSVSRHGRQPVARLWRIGRSTRPDRKLCGAAIIKARAVRSAALSVVSDEPPARHAVIRSWPQDPDPDMQKAKQKEIANILASAAGAPVLV